MQDIVDSLLCGGDVIRVILLLIIVMLVYWLLKGFAKTSASAVAQQLKKIGWLIAIAILAVLAVAGKLNWLFALLGVLLATFSRLLPVLLNYAPQLHRLWLLLRNAQASGGSSTRQPPPRARAGTMSREEALAILGLQTHASETDIIDAHRKLMQRMHPDRGGSDYLAAQINLAKKVLLGR